MKRILFSVLGLMASSAVLAQTALEVNGQVISSQSQKQIMQLLDKQGVKDKDQQLAMARNILVRQAVVVQEASKQKITTDPAVQLAIEEQKTSLLQNELIRRNVLNKDITESEAQKVYEDLSKTYNPNEIKLRHILVKTEKEATDLIASIKKGKDMANIAKEKSLDKASAKNGGEIPFTNIKAFAVPGFGEAGLALDKGQVRPIPFKSNLGYHIIKLEDKRTVPFPEFKKVRAEMEKLASQRKVQDYFAKLIRSAKVAEVQDKKKK